MFDGIGEWWHELMQNMIDGLGEALQNFLDKLPDSPFNLISNDAVVEYMGYLNWIVPVSEIVAILQLWITAILIYYTYVVILRWIRAIQ